MNLNRLRVILATCETHKGEMEIKRATGFSRGAIQKLLAFCVRTGLIEKCNNSRPTYIATDLGDEVLRNLSNCPEKQDNASEKGTQAYNSSHMKGRK